MPSTNSCGKPGSLRHKPLFNINAPHCGRGFRWKTRSLRPPARCGCAEQRRGGRHERLPVLAPNWRRSQGSGGSAGSAALASQFRRGARGGGTRRIDAMTAITMADSSASPQPRWLGAAACGTAMARAALVAANPAVGPARPAGVKFGRQGIASPLRLAPSRNSETARRNGILGDGSIH